MLTERASRKVSVGEPQAMPSRLWDYLFRWLELRFMKGEQGLLFEVPKAVQRQHEVTSAVEGLGRVVEMGDAPVCQSCG